MNNVFCDTSICWFGDVKIDCSDNLLIGEKLKKIIQSSDFRVVNFEAPINSQDIPPIEKSGPSILQKKESAIWLKENGFNVFSLANNHSMDYGKDALYETINTLKDLQVVGAGTWEDAYKPIILKCNNNRKIALIAGSHNEFGTLNDKYTDIYGCAWLAHPLLEKTIIDSKEKFDAVFLFAHAGIERIEQPLPEIRQLYRHFIDLGCDGVIASHPHIIQGWECYNGKPIVYSLGNFIFDDEIIDKSWLTSICCELILKDSIQMKIHIVQYNPKNHIVDIIEDKQVQNYLDRINNVLLNDALYIDYVNKFCLSFLSKYYSLISISGFVHPSKIISGIKGLLYKFIIGKCFPKKHFLNTIRCESHRWALIRALKLKYNIKN